MKFRIWLWLVPALIGACNRTEEWMPASNRASDAQYEQWMPLKKGAYFIWQGDSVILNSFFGTIDTVPYFHKMEIADTFTNQEDRLHLTAYHYYRRTDTSAPWQEAYAETFVVDSNRLLLQRPGQTLLFAVFPVQDRAEWDLYLYDPHPSTRAYYQQSDSLHAWLIHRADSTAIDYYRTAYLLTRDSGITRFIYDSLEINLNGDTIDGLRIRERLTQLYVP